MLLYALCDQALLDAHGIPLPEYIQIAEKFNARIIQYRNKSDDTAFIQEQLLFLRHNFQGKLIINDHLELVDFCDGLHVGQEDLLKVDADKAQAVRILRTALSKEKVLGLSTHNAQEVLEANGFDLDYIGLGAYRATNTKAVSSVLGDTIDAVASLSKHDVAAIGGVRLEDRFQYIKYNVIGSGLL
jgi:thiamine-phosphate pyrophosphorylase